MSLRPQPIGAIPEQTARVAHAAFPKGNPYRMLRDHLGTIFQDDDFAALFPAWGYPGLPPWRLALVTIMQFRENLADCQAAEAVRARIDWKYLLGLELTDPGFDFSVLSECRDRLRAGSAAERLLEKLLECCRARGLLKARGQQRTDSTHVLAAIRVLNRLELVAETLRAALNELATVAPAWLQGVAPLEWYERYGKRIEDTRLPQGQANRDAYAQTVGEDGFALLDALEASEVPEGMGELASIAALRQTWQRHYERTPGASPGEPAPVRRVRAGRSLDRHGGLLAMRQARTPPRSPMRRLPRAGARVRHQQSRRVVDRRRHHSDSRHRLSDSAHGLHRRGRDFCLAQSIRRQRHQGVFRCRREIY